MNDITFTRIDNARSVLTGKEVQHGEAKYLHDKAMMQASAARKRKTRSHRVTAKWDGKMDGPMAKAFARLDRRVEDYKRMVDDPKFKAPDGAFHKPGSMQGPR